MIVTVIMIITFKISKVNFQILDVFQHMILKVLRHLALKLLPSDPPMILVSLEKFFANLLRIACTFVICENDLAILINYLLRELRFHFPQFVPHFTNAVTKLRELREI